jgi:chromosome segregation ATPase
VDPRRPLTTAPEQAEDLEARLVALQRAHDALLEANRALGRDAFAKEGAAAAMAMTEERREIKRLLDQAHELKVRLVEEEQERARVVDDRDRLHGRCAELEARIGQLEQELAAPGHRLVRALRGGIRRLRPARRRAST